MKTIGLLDFFKHIGYNYAADLERIENICALTKTRGGDTASLSRGCEQSFLLKALVEWLSVKSFFEIGTGRGTACYSVSLVPAVEKILTMDLLEFEKKFQTAISGKSAFVSLKDLYDQIPYHEKSKVQFVSRPNFKNEAANGFDAFFIDGEHSDVRIIKKDFQICYDANPHGIFIFDDYENNRFAVKEVVDEILETHPKFNSLLVEFRGHLFGGVKEQNEGLVVIKEGVIL
jgi:predicted O-methyltransferase YrrM